MARRSKKSANPFYALLLVVGVLFAVTATAYGVMFVQEVREASGETSEMAKHPLMNWMQRHGNTALVVELALLAAGTFGAIATDDYWQRRSR